MSELTNIAWCDSTINFWSGCTKVSAGCANCYAEARDRRQLLEKRSHWGPGAPRLKGKGAVKAALAMNRRPWICDGCGEAFEKNPSPNCYCPQCDQTYLRPRRIFSLSLGDWLDGEVPIEWLAEMLDTIRQCDQVTWILCTKRPENFEERLTEAFEHTHGEGWQSMWLQGEAPHNVIVLTSVENQEQADKRIPELLKIPAVCRGLSVEPMLGQIRFRTPADFVGADGKCGIHWAIFGGESGPGARACNVEWIRDGVKQCQAAGVAAFVKQLGASYGDAKNGVAGALAKWPFDILPHGPTKRLKDKKGGDMAEWPVDLRVREFPSMQNEKGKI